LGGANGSVQAGFASRFFGCAIVTITASNSHAPLSSCSPTIGWLYTRLRQSRKGIAIPARDLSVVWFAPVATTSGCSF